MSLIGHNGPLSRAGFSILNVESIHPSEAERPWSCTSLRSTKTTSSCREFCSFPFRHGLTNAGWHYIKLKWSYAFSASQFGLRIDMFPYFLIWTWRQHEYRERLITLQLTEGHSVTVYWVNTPVNPSYCIFYFKQFDVLFCPTLCHINITHHTSRKRSCLYQEMTSCIGFTLKCLGFKD